VNDEKKMSEHVAKESFLGRVSRRSFLSQLGAAGVAAASAGPLSAAAQPVAAPVVAEGGAEKIEGAIQITLRVNGKPLQLEVDPRATLLDCLRESANLTGTKKGCDHGQCGACTVLIDGRRVNSCLTLAFAAEGPRGLCRWSK